MPTLIHAGAEPPAWWQGAVVSERRSPTPSPDGLGKDPALGDNPWPIIKPAHESAGRRHDEDWDRDPRRTEDAAASQLRLAPHEGLVLAAR